MKKNYEATIGTKLSNASNLAKVIAGLSDYHPLHDAEKPDNFALLVNAVEQANTIQSTTKQIRSLKVEERQQLFFKNEASLKNLLSTIRTAVKIQYGFSSKESKDVAARIKKLRPVSAKKQDDKSGAAADVTKKTISTSHLAFASVTENLKDLYVAIEQFTPAFSPPNNAISINSLKDLYTAMVTSNNEVNTANTAWSASVASRRNLLKQLVNQMKIIRATVKCQYGSKSAQYLAAR